MYLSQGMVPPAGEDNPVTGAMVILSVAGFIGLLFQFIAAVIDTRLGEREMRARITARVLADEMLRQGLAAEAQDLAQAKAKRMMRLTDDGELEEAQEDELLVDELPQPSSVHGR